MRIPAPSEKKVRKEEKEEVKSGAKIGKAIASVFPYIFCVAIVWILTSNVFQIAVIPSSSMYPTLHIDDIAIGLRINRDKLERQDIVVFYSDDQNEYMCKRVIGLPGDTVQFLDGYVYVNEEKIDESAYLDDEVETNCMQVFTVPANTVFLLGDNRENSYDARYWAQPYIDIGKISSKIKFVLPFHSIKSKLSSMKN